MCEFTTRDNMHGRVLEVLAVGVYLPGSSLDEESCCVVAPGTWQVGAHDATRVLESVGYRLDQIESCSLRLPTQCRSLSPGLGDSVTCNAERTFLIASI